MKARANDTVEGLSGALGRTLAALEPILPPREAAVPAASGAANSGAVYAS
jgi:hypothetical protein